MRLKVIVCVLFVISLISMGQAQEETLRIEAIASDLNNPRGVAVMPDGQLLVIEAGTGSDTPMEVIGSGRVLQLADNNNDGDFDDSDDQRLVRLDAQPSFNSLAVYRTGHDEPFGLSDVVMLDEDRIYFTLDHPFAEAGRNTGGEGYYGNVGIFILNTGREGATRFVQRSATLNSFAYDPQRDVFFATESGFNRIMAVDMTGDAEVVVELPTLANDQQPVPAGIAVDPNTGDLLVALFSGFVYDYYDTQMGFMPGDAKVVRIDPDTGTISDEITGLTTAIDVAVAEDGTLFVVELTTTWETNPMPFDFDLFDPEQPPDPGGYARYSGRVTMHTPDGEMRVLAQELDGPTNVTYHEGELYISTGLGTPGRRVVSHLGISEIEGVIYRITGF
ncbi:MAG: ScyD/ScyE family protein [Anaerolineae bacterium]